LAHKRIWEERYQSNSAAWSHLYCHYLHQWEQRSLHWVWVTWWVYLLLARPWRAL